MCGKHIEEKLISGHTYHGLIIREKNQTHKLFVVGINVITGNTTIRLIPKQGIDYTEIQQELTTLEIILRKLKTKVIRSFTGDKREALAAIEKLNRKSKGLMAA
jgi:hypothetical protein